MRGVSGRFEVDAASAQARSAGLDICGERVVSAMRVSTVGDIELAG